MYMTEIKTYPHFVVENNKKPNRFYAFPLIGFMVKIVLLLPVFLEIFALGFIALFAIFINWFFILLTGKYWDVAYKLFVGLLRLCVKIILFILGITDKYPGFALDTNNIFELDFTKPEKPNRWLAIPVIGIFIRLILLIPYLIFSDVMTYGLKISMVLSWFTVAFKNRFPESLYEFEKDSLRVSLAASTYILGLSDKYPSFNISMNHQTIKILLIIAGSLLTAWKIQEDYYPDDFKNKIYKYEYQRQNSSPSTNSDYKTY